MTTSSTTTWRQWLQKHPLPEDLFAEAWLDGAFAPTEQDRKAAWALYTELRTRISTQPLHYRAGDEDRALTSLFELFGYARQAIREHGTECRNFAILATVILNGVVRPFTAKWHKRKEAGQLELEYVRHEFRAELTQLQRKLLPFQTMLGRLAEGEAFVHGTETARNVTEQWESEANEQTLTGEQWESEAKEPGPTAEDSWWPAASADRKRLLLGERNGGGVLEQPMTFAINLPDQVLPETRHQMQRHEADVIKARRQAAGLDPNTRNPVGLAISGGGIRSSTFALGALQRLAQQGLLREVDFLSTVSGGGYVGSFLSSYLNSPSPEPSEDNPAEPFDNQAANPSTGSRRPIGLGPNELPFLGPNDNESPALRWIRNRSKYLVFGGPIRRLQIYGLAVYGVLANLFVTFPVVVLAVMLTEWLYGHELRPILADDQWPSFPAPGWPGKVWVGVLCLAALIVLALGPAQMLFSRHEDWRKSVLRGYEWIAAWTLPLVLLVAFVNVLPFAIYGVHQFFQTFHGDYGLGFCIPAEQLIAVIAALLPVLTAVASYLARNRRFVGPLMRGLFAVSGPLFFLTAYLLLVHVAVVTPRHSLAWLGIPWWLWLMFILPTIYGLWLLNVNFSAPHRFYRNRLSEAYLIQEDPGSDSEQPAESRVEAPARQHAKMAAKPTLKHVDAQKLSELCRNNPAAPYHLINTALNVSGSIEPELRGRNCDFFLFSQGYCGSTLTGYMKTEELEKLDWHVDLGTAMAISGAAAAPYMGIHTIRTARFLLTLLNIRLSYWLPNPGCKSNWCRSLRYWFPANGSYLFREMFGWLSHDRSRVNLSDGGHIENLGLYELLRRRCKFIVAIDGEQDNEMAWSSLMRLMRYAAIDLNADIRFPDLPDLVKDEHGFSASHFALGVIRYQPATDSEPGNATAGRSEADIGLILYIKSSLTGNEPATVLDYQRRHPDFPHQTTADQFFQEDQFEAYRSLGYHVASEALRPQLFDGPPPANLTVPRWFRTLVDKLLSD